MAYTHLKTTTLHFRIKVLIPRTNVKILTHPFDAKVLMQHLILEALMSLPMFPFSVLRTQLKVAPSRFSSMGLNPLASIATLVLRTELQLISLTLKMQKIPMPQTNFRLSILQTSCDCALVRVIGLIVTIGVWWRVQSNKVMNANDRDGEQVSGMDGRHGKSAWMAGMS